VAGTEDLAKSQRLSCMTTTCGFLPNLRLRRDKPAGVLLHLIQVNKQLKTVNCGGGAEPQTTEPFSPMINSRQKQKTWHTEPADIETSSEDYARRFSGKVGEWMLKVQEEIVLGLLRGTGISTVLDVGGGHGQLAVPLCHNGFNVTVAGSADVCRRRIANMIDAGLCRYQTADLLKLPFSAQAFDAVVCFRLITHCDRWQDMIAELCRMARHMVIIDYPTSQSINAAAPRLFSAKKQLEGNTRPFKLFRHAEIEQEFYAQKFTIAAREGQFFLPMVLHRIMKCRGLSALLEDLFKHLNLTRHWGSPVIIKAVRKGQTT
jgi:2-polyprenyl-3-methyl-5-hydroxy-6-metoxy-1,4-benzoquinol methylase